MTIAQITDLHIKPPGKLAYRVVDTAPMLERAVARIMALDPLPDLVIASGDLTDEGLPQEYERLRAFLAPLSMPVYLVMGNHDARCALRAAFPDHGYLGHGEAPIQYVIDGPVRIVVADTTDPGIHSGVLDPERLAWIDATLAVVTDRPTILVLHHPPFTTGIAALDAQPYPGAAELGALVRKHAHVERVACGHLHRPILARWFGTFAMTVPSTAHQIALDLRDGVPDTFTLEPPAFALHVWNGTSLVSHIVPVDRGAAPYAFREAGTLIP